MLSTKYIIDAAPRIYKLEKKFELIEKDFGFLFLTPGERISLALKKIIIGQQLSIAAAAAIWRAFHRCRH